MDTMVVSKYDLDVSSMDTTPISQSHLPEIPNEFLTNISSLPDPSLQNQLMHDLPTAFSDKPDHSTSLAASMHVSMPPELSPSVFMAPMDALDGPPQLHSASPNFSSDYAACDPFSLMHPLENPMALEMSPSSHVSSASPPQSQVPSPSIHGSASSYSIGVTSSLESALDPAGVSGGRSRASTSVSPGSIPTSFITTPVSQQISFTPSDSGEMSAVSHDVTPVEAEAHLILGEMLKDIAKTASSAGDACRLRHGAEASSKVDELKERISKVSEMISGMMAVSLSDNRFSTPPFLASHDSTDFPQVPVSHPEQHSLSFPPTTATSSMDLSDQLTVSDQSRKRCASELEEHRTVKAPKREPQDDIPLSLVPIQPVETSPIFNAPTVLPIPTTLQSIPPSRQPSPPDSFSSHTPFSPVKQQPPASSYQFMPTSPSSLDFATNSAAPISSVIPTFPVLHGSWSDSVIPSRHHHSMSSGSLNGSLQSLNVPPVVPLAPSNIDAFSTPPLHQLPPPPLVSASSAAVIGPPPGRMSRSGSINGTFTNPFGFGYMESFADTATAWPGINRMPASAPVSSAPPNWFSPNVEGSVPSVSSSTPEVPGTTRNTPTDEEDEEEDGDSEYNEGSPSKSENHLPSADGPHSSTASDVPQEYRAEVDRIFFEYLNKICSNLDATDSKGEPIHQTLMAKKMQRLDESPDFRPFKFRIQAFTLAFLEELAKQGYPEEKIPMKRIRNYLWRQQYILRFNEDGKKAKSKGNHIWNIEAKKAGDGKWEFRPFHRKLAGSPPGVAYCGLKWSWTPRVWDPQASWQNVPVQYSSPSLPAWLSWNDDVLSGVPPSDAESCQITANAKFVLDGQEGHLSHTFHITIAPMSTIDTSSFSQSRRPSLAGDPPRRSTSDSVLFQTVQRSKPRPPPSLGLSDSPDTRVIRVLQSVAQRVTEEAESQFVSASPPKQGELQDLVKQKHVLEQTVNAYDKEISGQSHAQTRRLAVAAQNVVVQAAHTVIADRTAAIGGIQTPQSESTAMQSVTVNELSDATQDAIAMAVKRNGTASTEVDIIVAATSILKARTPGSPSNLIDSTPSVTIQQTRSHSTGAIPSRLTSNGFPLNNLSSLSEYV